MRLLDWINHQNPAICCLQETPEAFKKHTKRLGWGKQHKLGGAGKAGIIIDMSDGNTT